MIDNIPQCVRKNLTGDLPITLKRRSAGSRRVPLAGWGFDSRPDDLDSPVKCFVLRLDILEIQPDVLLVLPDIFKICQIVLISWPVSYLYCWIILKSAR